jgi:nucleotide-binding universal stress UspA family protein
VEEVYPEGMGFVSPTSSFNEGMAPNSLAHGSQPIIIDLVEMAQTGLHDFAAKHLKAAAPVQVKVAVGKPAEEILRVAREEKVDLIAMGTHGRTGLQHLLLGSVAEDVTQHAPCPIFTVRIGADAASSGISGG